MFSRGGRRWAPSRRRTPSETAVWDDPAAWALGAALVLALTVPPLVMMGRRMFGRRKQETTMSDESTAVQTKPGERDPQSQVREQAMMTDEAEATEAIRVAKH